MKEQNLKQRLWKRVVSLARKHKGFRMVVIFYLTIYYWNRMTMQAIRRNPQAVPAVMVALCLFFAVPFSVLADVGMGLPGGITEASGEMDFDEEDPCEEDSQDDRPLYCLDVELSAPEEIISEGYEKEPEFVLTLTNTGQMELTGLDVILDRRDTFILYYEEDGIRYEVIPKEPETEEPEPSTEEGTESSTEEVAEEEPETAAEEMPVEEPETAADAEETSEEDAETATEEAPETGTTTEDATAEDAEASTERMTGEDVEAPAEDGEEESPKEIEKRYLPEILGENSCLIVYIALPLGRETGVVEDVCHIKTNELEEEFSFPLVLDIKKTETGENPPDEGGEGQQPEKPDTGDEGAGNGTDPGMNGTEPNGGDATDSDPSDIESGQETGDDETEKKPEDEFKHPAVSVQCITGYKEGDSFFTMGRSRYIIQMASGSTVPELYYEIGNLKGTAEASEGIAIIDIPENVSDFIEIYCFDPKGNKVIVSQGYAVNESIAPSVQYDVIEKSGEKYARIIVEDLGEVVSGLGNVVLNVDGKTVAKQPDVLSLVRFGNQKEMVSGWQYEILMEGTGEHAFEVVAKDNSGNEAREKFFLSGGRTDIIRVVLPTSFKIAIMLDDKKTELYGENIVLCNRSEFPIDVNVASAEVMVDHTIPTENIMISQILSITTGNSVSDVRELAASNKSCELTLNLLLADANKKQIPGLKEGITSNLASFVLAAGKEGTNINNLHRYSMDPPKSSDYAILNLRGVVDQSTRNCWRTGDLEVKIVFRFNKQVLKPEPEFVEDTGISTGGTLTIGEVPTEGAPIEETSTEESPSEGETATEEASDEGEAATEEPSRVGDTVTEQISSGVMED